MTVLSFQDKIQTPCPGKAPHGAEPCSVLQPRGPHSSTGWGCSLCLQCSVPLFPWLSSILHYRYNSNLWWNGQKTGSPGYSREGTQGGLGELWETGVEGKLSQRALFLYFEFYIMWMYCLIFKCNEKLEKFYSIKWTKKIHLRFSVESLP